VPFRDIVPSPLCGTKPSTELSCRSADSRGTQRQTSYLAGCLIFPELASKARPPNTRNSPSLVRKPIDGGIGATKDPVVNPMTP